MRALALGLLLMLVCVFDRSAHGQSNDNALIAEVVPSHQTMLSRRARSLASDAERLVSTLAPGAQVSVHVSLPDESRLPIDQPPQPTNVVVSLEAPAPFPEESQVAAIVRASSADLAHAHVSVIVMRLNTSNAVSPSIETVGPFRVMAGSAWLLRAVIAVLLASNAGLAAMLLTRRSKRPL